MAYQYKTTQGLSVLAVFTGLTACTSLDPKPDFDRAREIASPRLNTDIDLESALSRNPNELPSSWDGTAPLDINTAVLIAFERDTMIRRAMEEIAIRRADLVQSELAPNPVRQLRCWHRRRRNEWRSSHCSGTATTFMALEKAAHDRCDQRTETPSNPRRR